jgi:hypothetical protein
MFVLVVLGVAAFGAQRILADDVVYHACVNNSSGSIFIVESETDCTNNETYISWNHTGPQGLQGIQGDPGPQGPKGDTGAQGAPGVVNYYRVWNQCGWGNSTCGPCQTPLCASGDKIIGGGYGYQAGGMVADGVFITYNYPDPAYQRWSLYICNYSGAYKAYTVHGICADMTP